MSYHLNTVFVVFFIMVHNFMKKLGCPPEFSYQYVGYMIFAIT